MFDDSMRMAAPDLYQRAGIFGGKDGYYLKKTSAIVITIKLLNACAAIGAMMDPRHSRKAARTTAMAPSIGIAAHP
jgi:hypothetical protein